MSSKKLTPDKLNNIYNKYASPNKSINSTPTRQSRKSEFLKTPNTTVQSNGSTVTNSTNEQLIEIIDLTVEKFTQHNTHYTQSDTLQIHTLLHLDTILLNQTDLHTYSLHVAEPVLLLCGNVYYLYAVNTYHKVQSKHCRLHTHNTALLEHCHINDAIQIHRIKHTVIQQAKTVTINIQCTNAKLYTIIQHYVQTNLRNQHVTPTQQFVIKLFDSTYYCTVVSVDNSNKQVIETSDELVESINRLKLTQHTDKPIVYHITDTTQFNFVNNLRPSNTVQLLLLNQIGGLNEQIKLLRELIELPITQSQLYKAYNIKQPHGILLHGRTGTGKTMLAQSLGHTMKLQHNVNVYSINAVDLLTNDSGSVKLQQLFDTANATLPSLLIIDNIDLITQKRKPDDYVDDTVYNVMSVLLTAMDGVQTKDIDKHVIVIGTTNKLDTIDSAVRRSGRFDYEIELPIPNRECRYDILQSMLKQTKHNLTQEQIQQISNITHGYVGTDLAQVVTESAMYCIQQHYKQGILQQCIDTQTLCIRYEDIQYALNTIKPSAMRELTIDIPTVTWNEIGGNDTIKHKLIEAIELPLHKPELFKHYNITPPKGILLYGPPGNSKTMIAKALANQSQRNFITVKSNDLFSKYVGDSEKAVQSLFAKARTAAPCIIFIDEIDSLASQRSTQHSDVDTTGNSRLTDRVLSQLLIELDGIEPLTQVTVLAATNRPDMIDTALLRPGRIDRILYVSLPDIHTRVAILNVRLRKSAHILTENDIQDIAEQTERYSGAELIELCNVAAYTAMQRNVNVEYMIRADFDTALQQCKPRTTDEAIQYYKSYRRKANAINII